MSWSRYVVHWSGGEVNRVIAQKVGVSEPSVARWKNGGIKTPDAQQAAAFARAYGRPVLEAFVEAGFLTAEEAKARPAVAPDYSQLTPEELLALVEEFVELTRARMREESETDGHATPVRNGLTVVEPAKSAARRPGKLSKGQQRAGNAQQAGEPELSDPEDFEPR